MRILRVLPLNARDYVQQPYRYLIFGQSYGAQMTSSLTPATSVTIVSEILRIDDSHIELSKPHFTDIAKIVKVVERAETQNNPIWTQSLDRAREAQTMSNQTTVSCFGLMTDSTRIWN